MARHKFTDEEAAAQERMNAGGSYTDPSVPTTPRFDPDATMNSYRQTGDDMARRQAVQLQYGTANADRQNNLGARETQIEAGGMMRNAAVGGAPSRAAIEGAQVGDASLEAQLGASAGRRGPALAQSNAAATGATGLQLQGANTAGLGRSAETNRALLAYGQNTGAMRKGDYTLQQLDQRQAEAQAQQQLNQNRRNQTGQMDMEQLGLNDEQARMDLSNRQSDLLNKQDFQTQTNQENRTANGAKIIKGLEDMMPSDERMKSKAALPGLAAKGRAMLEQSSANRDSLRYGPSVGKRVDPSLEARGRAMLAQNDADRDSLRYGSSLHAQPRDEEPPNENDVQEIRYGKSDPNPEDVDQIRGGVDRPNQGDVNRIKHGDAIDVTWEAEGMPDKRGGTSERGIGGVERGYAKMRENQMGGNLGMNRSSWDLGSGYSDDPDKEYSSSHKSDLAPGTEDFYRYGEPRKVRRPVKNADEYIPGQAPTEQVDAPMDDYSRAVSMSDARAKQQAFLDGVNHADKMLNDPEHATPPAYMPATRTPRAGATTIEVDKPSLAPGKETNREGPSVETEEAPRRDVQSFTREKPSAAPTTAGLRAPQGAVRRGIDALAAHPFTTAPGSPYAGAEAVPAFQKAAVTASKGYERTSDERAKTASHDDERALQQDANRKLQGSTYTYKDGVGEDPNQVHHGQMAQTMEENPITATAVREGPDGMKRVSEFDKLNVTASGVAELQREQDEMRAELERMRGRRQRRPA